MKTYLLFTVLLFNAHLLFAQYEHPVPRFHLYVQGTASYTQFMRMATGVGEGDFSNYWKSQLGGNLTIGWRKNSAFGPRPTFSGQVGLLLHRTRPQSRSSYYFSRVGLFSTIGLEVDQKTWKVGLFPWLAYFPNVQYRNLDQYSQEKYQLDNWWVGLSLNLSRQITQKLDLTTGLYYGRYLSNIPFRGIGGSIYGYERDMPFWVQFGLRYFPFRNDTY